METPAPIVAWEASPEFSALCEQQTRSLLASAQGESPKHDFFYSALLPEDQGIITVQSRVGPAVLCAVFFSSPRRLAIYANQLLGGVRLTPIQFTAAEAAAAMAELSRHGVSHLTLDRCPRCWTFPVSPASVFQSASSALTHWSFVKAVEFTRANYYLQYARHRASAGDLAASRDVALLAVAHVTPDDVRLHAHLAEIAEKLDDEVLRFEARDAVRKMENPSRFAALLHFLEWRVMDSAIKV